MNVPHYNAKEVARFWSYVDKRSTDACWPWLRATPAPGYGEFSGGGTRVKAHRASFYINIGPIPDGMVIDHVCRNRACVNPAHLRAVDHRTNSIENSTSFAARNAQKTHCPKWHVLAGSNLVPSQKTRKCRICLNERQVLRNRRRRALAKGNLFAGEAA